MSVVAVAIGGSIISGAIAADAAGNAADAQKDAAAASNDTQRYMYDQTREDNKQWRDAGGRALTGLEEMTGSPKFTMADFQKDPGYDFRMKEGQKAIDASASARGSLNSGATLKALSRYGQDYASGEYQNAYNRFQGEQTNRFNRLSSIAGIGQTANAATGNAGQNYANQVSQNQIGVGNANAAAQMAGANAAGNVINTGINAWSQYEMMNRFAPAVKK